MNRIHTDSTLRAVLHDLYAALFAAHKRAPSEFPNGRLTTIMTGIMGIENIGWRVVGITQNALEVFASNEFKLPPRKLCRGHIKSRAATARNLFDRDRPLPLLEFFDVFLGNDCTVIMTIDENRPGTTFPDYHAIDNPDADLFPNAAMMGWKHRKRERDFLRDLYESIQNKR